MGVITLCPGQGAQHVGMGRAWRDNSEAAARTFAEADDLLGMDLSRICFEGPSQELDRTDTAQVAIYVTSIACLRALEDLGTLSRPGQDGPSQVAGAAGLSLGEFTALHVAGALDFETGLRLVQLRGRAMQEAAEAAPSGMVALVGADEQQAIDLCKQACAATGNGALLVPANFNCPGQVVVSGSRSACKQALPIAEKMGLRAKTLAVSGAFHSPLMQPAAERLAEALEQSEWHEPAVPVISNVTALPHDGDARTISTRLVEQLTHPVRWSQSMQWMLGNLEGRLVELAPGKVLAGLMRRIDRSARVENFSDPHSPS